MKTIYHLRQDFKYVEAAQAASLSAKPFGLKVVNGLFGSEEWWHNVETGVIPLIRYKGTITRLFRAGMHNESECFEIVGSDGQMFHYDCISLNRRDRKLYKVGAYVELAFVRQELKHPVLTTTGDIYDTHSRSLIEVRIKKGATITPWFQNRFGSRMKAVSLGSRYEHFGCNGDLTSTIRPQPVQD